MNLGFLKIAAATQGATVWMPRQASTVAADVDNLFYFIYYVCAVSFVAVVVAMVYFVIKYKKKSDRDVTSANHGNTKLEVIWSVIPGMILLFVFAWGVTGWRDMSIPPGNTLDVRVTGQKWNWNFAYPSGISSGDLVVPVGKNVKLTMISKDVLHSFFVPDFRIKRDVLPNRYTVLWFNAMEIGEHWVQCAEYCGTSHSKMLAKVNVLSQEDYDKWVESDGGMKDAVPTAAMGEQIAKKSGCNACHSINGDPGVGPSWLGIYGAQHQLADGSTVTVDDNYIRESILDPNAKIVKGFAASMPTFKGQLKDKQIESLIEYMKTLSKK